MREKIWAPHRCPLGDLVCKKFCLCVKESLKGWLVVIASFLSIALLDGAGYTTGILIIGHS